MSTDNHLESEISQALACLDTGGKTKRNVEILKSYYGLDGKGGNSMEAVAQPYNMTRESVRQITNRCLAFIDSRQFQRQSCGFPVLASIAKRLRRLLPISARDLSRVLLEEGYTASYFDARGILNALSIFGVESPEINRAQIGDELFLLPAGMDTADARKILSMVTKEVSHNGACDIRRIAEAVPEGTQENRLRFVRGLLATRPAHAYLDERGYWVYFRRVGRNRLINRLDRIFSFVESASVSDIMGGISRSWKKNEMVKTQMLPRSVLTLLISDLGVFEIENGVVTRRFEGDPQDELGDMELGMARFIAESDNGIRHEKEMEDHLVRDISKKRAFSMALNYSPLILKKDRGQYRLVGRAA